MQIPIRVEPMAMVMPCTEPNTKLVTNIAIVITIISDDITMKHQIQTFCDAYAEEFHQDYPKTPKPLKNEICKYTRNKNK